MKVLHVCRDFHPSVGGIEKFVLDLARRSRSAGIETRILCYNRTHGYTHLPAQDEIDGIPIRRIAFIDLKYYKPAWLPLAELKGSDVVHVHGVGALLDFAVLTKPLHRRPILMSTHGGIFHTQSIPLIKHLYFHRLHRLAQHAVDCTVASSRQDLQLFTGVSRRLTLIENGAEIEPYLSAPIAGKDPLRFVYIGRVARSKQVHLLIETIAHIARVHPQAKLHIVGPEREGLRPSLLELADRLGTRANVEFLGEVDAARLVHEMAAATFALSASEYEGFGISAIEGMAAGCVPVLNDIDAFRNLIRPGEGLLVDYRDPAAAAEKILTLMRQDTLTVAQAARNRATEFSWERKMVEWKKVYEAVVGG